MALGLTFDTVAMKACDGIDTLKASLVALMFSGYLRIIRLLRTVSSW